MIRVFRRRRGPLRLARHQSAFVVASVLTVVSFLAATAYSQRGLAALDTLSSAMAVNAIPSIEYLGRGGMRLQRLRQLLYDEVMLGPSADTTAKANLELRELDADISEYLDLTPLEGERELWVSMRNDLDEARDAARSILQAVQIGDSSRAASLLHTRAEPAFERAGHTMLATMEFDVRESERLAREVGSFRRETTQKIIFLNLSATAVAAFTAVIAFRTAREHDRLLQRHNALLTDRVADLDRFAGRVAHDILSPLDTVAVGLALVDRSGDAGVHGHVERAQRGLERVKQLVDALLRFSRAGGEVDAGARTPLGTVLKSAAADASDAAAAANIEIAVDAPDRLDVACSAGVLTSMVQNLVSNAIKYMGSAPVRRVTLRASAAAGRARVEIEDTGPGIPPALQHRMFQPFVRGAHGDISGIGLGLATVKRLVEAHGGAVHVRSHAGTGTVFSLDLPLAPEPFAQEGSRGRG
jgi:signal transduction histidine kinase